jgi:hypothetical protein
MTGAYVRAAQAPASASDVQAQLVIAVDTAYVAGSGGSSISAGIYLMDNQVNEGSTGEGGMALHSVVPIGALIGFSAYPINIGSGDKVAITGFSVVSGDVFGSPGYPIEQAKGYWIGQAMNIGSQIYQIQLCITAGSLRPTDYYVHAQAGLSAR